MMKLNVHRLAPIEGANEVSPPTSGRPRNVELPSGAF